MPAKRVASTRRSATPIRSPLAPQLSMTLATMAAVLGTAQSTDGAPPVTNMMETSLSIARWGSPHFLLLLFLLLQAMTPLTLTECVEMRWAALALRLSQFPSAVIALRQDLTDLLGTSLSCSHTHRPAFL